MQETIRVLVDLLQKECAPVVAQGRINGTFLISKLPSHFVPHNASNAWS